MVRAENIQTVSAAVQRGADFVAVPMLPTRSRILAEETEYARARGVKLFTELDGAIADNHLTDVLKLAAVSARCGADGLILGDLGVYSAVRKILPDIPVIAGSRLTVSSCGGTQALAELGFCGAFISSGIGGYELERIVNNSPIDVIIADKPEAALVKILPALYDSGRAVLLPRVENTGQEENTALVTEYFSVAIRERRNIRASEIKNLNGKLPLTAIRAALLSGEIRPAEEHSPKPRYRGGEFLPPSVKPEEPKRRPQISVSVTNPELLTHALIKLAPLILYIPVDVILADPQKIAAFAQNGKTRICAAIPAGEYDFTALEQLKPLDIYTLLISDAGHIAPALKAGFKLRADFGIEVRNSQTLQLLRELGFESACISEDTPHHEIAEMFKYLPIEVRYHDDIRKSRYGITWLRTSFDKETERECTGRLKRILTVLGLSSRPLLRAVWNFLLKSE
jgi:collagenase-like PrtC family protease